MNTFYNFTVGIIAIVVSVVNIMIVPLYQFPLGYILLPIGMWWYMGGIKKLTEVTKHEMHNREMR